MESSTGTKTSGLRSEILSRPDFEDRPALNAALTNLVNETFSQVKAADPSLWEPSQIRPRFPDSSSLTTMLGRAGMCAVIFDSVNGTDIPVATASVIPSDNAELIGSYWDDGNLPIEFELLAVVSHPSPTYRRRGLASRCCKMLEDCVSALLQASFSGTDPSKSAARPSKSWRLRLHTVEEESVEYWRRRGFQETGRHPLPIGTWGCKKERTITSMMRDIPLVPDYTGVSILNEVEFSRYQVSLQPYLINQALTEQAASIARRREEGRPEPVSRKGPDSARNEDLASASILDELRESCRELLKPGVP
ncbi:uncharacterized protein BDZ99DRAFT_480420 [Mytilinidion resinicola]|uniref:Uncharacterized protein n=1 Tax=Mytilinidion resinicola TaxID=574789 RepID=A0A6A6YCK9_9PEZI|nr:uncharacterized protein BDZ99DRAFT_480420 [Mytilinidion resinicola]KAF2805754.1 hypothetical protein BDZ99DRAFT_480420 [Mytilinidion resinicola]